MTSTVLRTLIAEAPSAMDAHGFGKRRCILATRVAVEVLRRFGIEAAPHVVTVRLANAEAIKMLARGAPNEGEWMATRAHFVAIDTDPASAGGYPGHLVALMGDERMVDLNMDQFRREWARILPPDAAVMPAPPVFVRGEKSVEIELPHRSAMEYRTLTDGIARPFEDAVDWRCKGTWFPVVRDLVLRIEAELRTRPAVDFSARKGRVSQ